MGSLSALGGGLIGYVVPFLFVLTIVVFFHELGHFLMARLCGIKVLVFSIGFGPEIAGFYDRYGTRWKISAVPLGGYVKFFGDDNAASVPDQSAAAAMTDAERKDSFMFQPVGSRAAVVAAGPIANFVLAIAIFAAIFMTVGKQTTSARVDTVQPASAAEAAGFKPGDLVIAINGEKIESFSDMQRIVSISAGETLSIDVDRGGAPVTLKATPQLKELKDNFGNVHRLGVLGISRSMSPGDIKTEKAGPLRADRHGCAGNVVCGRPDACLHQRSLCGPRGGRPARWANPDCPGFGSGCHGRIHGPDPFNRGAFSFDWSAEPIPDPFARWWTPFVLRNRDDSRAAIVRAGAGGRVPNWVGDRRDVDDFCNL